MGTRYYNPTTTRFLSPDPYGHQGSIDLYSYANGNPIKYADPDGRYASPVYEVEKTWVKKHLSTVQTGLDFAGMLPGVGAVFDLTNAAIHLAQGNFVDAGLSLASAVPGFGDAMAAGKLLNNGAGMVIAMGIVKGGDSSAAKYGRQVHRELREKVLKKGDPWQSEPLLQGKDGKFYRPNIVISNKRIIELKPNTPSGRAKGEKQLENYKKQLNVNQGKVIYYEPKR